MRSILLPNSYARSHHNGALIFFSVVGKGLILKAWSADKANWLWAGTSKCTGREKIKLKTRGVEKTRRNPKRGVYSPDNRKIEI